MRALLDILLAAACGAFLVRAGWPGAPDLIEATDVAPWREALARAVAFLLAGLLLALRPRDLVCGPQSTVVVGLAIGVTSGLLAPLFGALAWPFLLAAVLLLVGMRRSGAATPAQNEGDAGALSSLVALGFVAAGTTGALVAVARLARRAALDSSADGAAFASAFAVLTLVGALAFGRPFAAEGADARERRTSPLPLGAASAAAVLSLASLVVTAGVVQQAGLRALARRFGIDASLSGTLAFDLLVASAAFVLPAFAVGATLYLARSRGAWIALATGAAAGALAPLTLGPVAFSPPAPREAVASAGSAGLVLDAMLVAGVGVALAGLARRGVARVAFILVGASLLAVAAFAPVAFVGVPKAFERFQPTPGGIVEAPSGQFLVDGARAGLERVTLDQRAIVPGLLRAAAERRALEQSLRRLPDDVRERGARVLLVGALSPGRAVLFEDLGCARVDRSSGYWRALEKLEAYLARDVPLPHLDGEVLAPGEARARAAVGDYDLVVVPPIEGNAPHARALAAPPETTQLLWLDARDELGGVTFAAGATFAGGALLVSVGAEELLVGRVLAGSGPKGSSAPLRIPVADDAATTRIERLRVNEADRRRDNVVRFADRMARATRGSSLADLGAGLAAHFAAQAPSSPFEGAAQRVELDRSALDRLFAHATFYGPGAPPDPFTRELWNDLVAVIRAKRDVPLAFELVEPLEGLWRPWIEGALCLAWAEQEELEHEAAIDRLEPLVAEHPGERRVVLAYAEALDATGRSADAIQALRRLHEAVPADRGVRKRLARALIAAGDPEGRRIAQDLVREDPDDGEAWALTLPGGRIPGPLSGPPR